MELNAEKRQEKGKKVKKFRRNFQIPAVLIEKAKESISLVVKEVDFTKVFRAAGETDLIDLKIAEGSNQKVLIGEVQKHPITLKPIHAVFRKVDLTEKLTVAIPVEIINEEENPVVKAKEGLILKLLDEIEVEALPTDLPHSFEIDALKLKELGDAITIADLEYDRSKVEVIGHEADAPVVKLDKVEEQMEEPEVSEEEALAKLEATEELTEEEKAEKAKKEEAEE